MRDGIELGKRGVPAIVLLPAGLADAAQDKARWLGMPALPLAIIEEPLFGMTPDAMRAAAAALAPVILGALVAR